MSTEPQGCVVTGNAIICYGRRWTYRRIMRCPICERRTRHVMSLEGYYGSTIGCLACGDEWSDGELQPRPFRPGWRDKSRARLRRMWDEAIPKSEAIAAENAWLYADLDDEEIT